MALYSIRWRSSCTSLTACVFSLPPYWHRSKHAACLMPSPSASGNSSCLVQMLTVTDAPWFLAAAGGHRDRQKARRRGKPEGQALHYRLHHHRRPPRADQGASKNRFSICNCIACFVCSQVLGRHAIFAGLHQDPLRLQCNFVSQSSMTAGSSSPRSIGWNSSYFKHGKSHCLCMAFVLSDARCHASLAQHTLVAVNLPPDI